MNIFTLNADLTERAVWTLATQFKSSMSNPGQVEKRMLYIDTPH